MFNRVRDKLKRALGEGLLRKPSLKDQKKSLAMQGFSFGLIKFASLPRSDVNSQRAQSAL